MKTFSVIWEIRYYDHEPEKVFFEVIDEDWENLDALLDDLRDNAIDREPENSCPFGLGDFETEWILIEDEDGKEVWRDKYYSHFEDKDWLEYNKKRK